MLAICSSARSRCGYKLAQRNTSPSRTSLPSWSRRRRCFCVRFGAGKRRVLALQPSTRRDGPNSPWSTGRRSVLEIWKRLRRWERDRPRSATARSQSHSGSHSGTQPRSVLTHSDQQVEHDAFALGTHGVHERLVAIAQSTAHQIGAAVMTFGGQVRSDRSTENRSLYARYRWIGMPDCTWCTLTSGSPRRDWNWRTS